MTDEMRADMAERIKHLVYANKLRQKDLAAMLETNESHVSLLINARIGLSMAMALRLAEAFGTGVDWLLGLTPLEHYNQAKGGVWK
jgi:plasmid maintenance system antidote protein VapI